MSFLAMFAGGAPKGIYVILAIPPFCLLFGGVWLWWKTKRLAQTFGGRISTRERVTVYLGYAAAVMLLLLSAVWIEEFIATGAYRRFLFP
jgi:hypothetical protein